MSQGKCASAVAWYGLSTNFVVVLLIIYDILRYCSNYLKRVPCLCFRFRNDLDGRRASAT